MPRQVPPIQAETQRPRRILFAQGDELLRAAIRGPLRSPGHSVEAVINGREAIESAAREAFDRAFLAIDMPEMGGLDEVHLLGWEQAGGPRPRIIGLSAQGEGPNPYAAAGWTTSLSSRSASAAARRPLGGPVRAMKQ